MDVAELDRSLEQGIRRLILAVWRHKFLAVLTSGLVFAALMVGVLAIRPLYEASTTLIGGQAELQRTPGEAQKPAETGNALSRIADSDFVVRQAIEKVGLHRLVDNANPDQSGTFARIRALMFPSLVEPHKPISEIDALLPRIKAGLNVRAEPNSDIIHIAFKHKDPAIAAEFANAAGQAFVDRQIALFSRPGAAEFFMRQSKRFDDQIKQASDNLERFAVATGTYSAVDQQQMLLSRVSDLSSSLTATRSLISEKLGQRQALADELRKLAPVARSSYVSSIVDALSPGSSARSGENHALDDRSSDPPLLLVKVYQDSMDTLFKINADLTGTQNLQKQQTEELAKLTSDLNSLADNEQEFSRLRRAVAQATYNSDLYSKRMVEEQITAESDAAKFSSAKVLQQATQPLRPVFPNYILVTIVSFLFSLLVGVGVAFLREQRYEPDVRAHFLA